MSFVWLSGGTPGGVPFFMVCHSLANACHNGAAGNHVFQFCSECDDCRAGVRCNRMAGKPSHVIVESKSGKKRAVRIRP